jgi:hypothetical protein
MERRPRICYSVSQKARMWDRWQKGDSLQQIAQLFDRNHSSIERILAETGGMRPDQRRRSRLALTLAELTQSSRRSTCTPPLANEKPARVHGRRHHDLAGDHPWVSLCFAFLGHAPNHSRGKTRAARWRCSADNNINELLENLNGTFHRLRQSSIDEDLFDVISGFEALVGTRQVIARTADYCGDPL